MIEAGDILIMPDCAEPPAGWTRWQGRLWRIATADDVLLPPGAEKLPYRIEGAAQFVPTPPEASFQESERP